MTSVVRDSLLRFASELAASSNAAVAAEARELAERAAAIISAQPGTHATSPGHLLKSSMPLLVSLAAITPGSADSEGAKAFFLTRLAAEVNDPDSTIFAAPAATANLAGRTPLTGKRSGSVAFGEGSTAGSVGSPSSTPAKRARVDMDSSAAPATPSARGAASASGTADDMTDAAAASSGAGSVGASNSSSGGADGASGEEVAVKTEDGGGAGAGAEGGSADGSGQVYKRKDENAKQEEDIGILQFRVIRNDGDRRHMIWLTQVKNIFATQLPKMPREYIARLVFDRKHLTLMALKKDKVVGAICYRPFLPQAFAEIAFCAITSSEQVRGYGTRLMNHLKEAVKLDGITHFLTYADNFAIGYFRKQGFTSVVSMPAERWVGYIKDYDGGTLMECSIYQTVNYLDVPRMIAAQKEHVQKCIQEVSTSHIVYPGLSFAFLEGGSSGAAGPARSSASRSAKDNNPYLPDVERIPGIREAGWRSGSVVLRESREGSTGAALIEMLSRLTTMVVDYEDSWPFRKPVDTSVVTDYLAVVKDPVDLSLISHRVHSGYYRTLAHWLSDMRTMTENCRKYNKPDTPYVSYANKVDAFVDAKIRNQSAWSAAGVTGATSAGAAVSSLPLQPARAAASK